MMTNPNYNRVTAKDSPHNSCQSATLCPNQGVQNCFRKLVDGKNGTMAHFFRQINLEKKKPFFFYEVLGMQVRTYII